jgi:hypothetical protein
MYVLSAYSIHKKHRLLSASLVDHPQRVHEKLAVERAAYQKLFNPTVQ